MDDLAQQVGALPTDVSNTLAGIERLGGIETDNGVIVVKDMGQLRTLVR